MDYKKLILTAVVMLVLDGIFISMYLGPKFVKMVESIQNAKVNMNMIMAIFAYVALVFQLYYFIIKDNRGLVDAFILGATSYAIFDFTNAALFAKYNMNIAITDIVWGGSLYALTTYIVNKI
tara:strand:- start:8 stop:373 length:366 start_codon:yes stop_codon:yes gene_type:complete